MLLGSQPIWTMATEAELARRGSEVFTFTFIAPKTYLAGCYPHPVDANSGHHEETREIVLYVKWEKLNV
jgi:hypothetical protein